jgi:hypothetical protein
MRHECPSLVENKIDQKLWTEINKANPTEVLLQLYQCEDEIIGLRFCQAV